MSTPTRRRSRRPDRSSRTAGSARPGAGPAPRSKTRCTSSGRGESLAGIEVVAEHDMGDAGRRASSGESRIRDGRQRSGPRDVEHPQGARGCDGVCDATVHGGESEHLDGSSIVRPQVWTAKPAPGSTDADRAGLCREVVRPPAATVPARREPTGGSRRSPMPPAGGGTPGRARAPRERGRDDPARRRAGSCRTRATHVRDARGDGRRRDARGRAGAAPGGRTRARSQSGARAVSSAASQAWPSTEPARPPLPAVRDSEPDEDGPPAPGAPTTGLRRPSSPRRRPARS